ncbi:hypothetical protein N9A51_01280 [Pseudomonadales bacterium]|nr:hypothetical protein [Pseudomonadales bacterium]
MMNAGMEAIAAFTMNITIDQNGIFMSTMLTLLMVEFSMSMSSHVLLGQELN